MKNRTLTLRRLLACSLPLLGGGAALAQAPTPQTPTLRQNSVPTWIAVPNQEQARDIAETVYNTWRQSMINSNLAAWQSATAQSRQVKVRNMIVSQKREFPRSLFAQEATPPALVSLRYVGALTGANGYTLACTYIGKADLGIGGKPANTALVLLFVHENGKWKYDQLRFFNLSHLPQVAERLRKKDIAVLKEQDGFHPYEKLPATPPPCPAPQYIAKVFVDAPGRVVDMTINGISHHNFEDVRLAEIVSGGLRRGNNTISYTIRDIAKPAEGAKTPPLAIGLFIMPETEGNVPGRCFEYIVGEGDPTVSGNYSFTVSDDTIRAMNPKNSKGVQPAPFRPVPLKQKPEEGK